MFSLDRFFWRASENVVNKPIFFEGFKPSLIHRFPVAAMAALTFVGPPVAAPTAEPRRRTGPGLGRGEAPWEAVARETAWKPFSTTGGGGKQWK